MGSTGEDQPRQGTCQSMVMEGVILQPDHINMAVLFWYLVKSDVMCTLLYISVDWTSQILQGSRNTRPCITGHPAYGQKIQGSNYMDNGYVVLTITHQRPDYNPTR